MAEIHAPLFVAMLAGLSTTLFVVAILRHGATGRHTLVQHRLRQLTSGEQADPLTHTFGERVLQPVLEGIVHLATSILPTRIVASVDRRIEMAARPTTVGRFLAVWATSGICVPLAAGTLLVIFAGGLGRDQMVAIALWVLVGLYVPWSWLGRRAAARAARIGRDLPDAMDLVVTNVEAGLGMQAALVVVAEKFGGPISEELARVVREINVGVDRTKAFNAMAERSGVPEVRLFARAVAQAEQTGTSVSRLLRNHSVEVREKRRQRAREQAAKIPVKITIPTVLVMCPPLFLLILGPVVLSVMVQLGMR